MEKIDYWLIGWLMGIFIASAVIIVIFYLQGINIFNPPGRCIQGCWFGEVQEEAFKGNWVCVNVQGISLKKAYEVCRHEVGHEAFARICQKNMTKCLELEI